jgi:hypothetical protein
VTPVPRKPGDDGGPGGDWRGHPGAAYTRIPVYAVDRTLRESIFEWRDAVLRPPGGAVALARVVERRDGELVRVYGRVRAQACVEGALHRTPGVFRRVVFVVGGVKYVHERGVDFRLVDDSRQLVVRVGGGRMIVPREELIEHPAHRLAGIEAFGLRGAGTVQACEHVLMDGALVEVIGYRTSVVDPSGDPSGYRGTAQAVALRSSRSQALLIVPMV